MNEYYIFDDILNKDSLTILQEYFVKNQNKLKWFYFETIVTNKSNVKKFFTNPAAIDTKIGDGFVIPIPNEYIKIDKDILSIIDDIIKIVQEKINKKFDYTLRTKINLTTPQIFSEKDIEEAIHVDRHFEHISFVFYINTNDGCTILYEKDKKTIIEKIHSLENRVLVFDGLIPHAGIPSTNDNKCVINCNLIEKRKNRKLI